MEGYSLRTILYCHRCNIYFSEIFADPISGLKTPLSRIIIILKARSERMSLNANVRVHRDRYTLFLLYLFGLLEMTISDY